MAGMIPETYAPFAERIFAAFAQPAAVTTESDVADAVWRAANDVVRAAAVSSGRRCGGVEWGTWGSISATPAPPPGQV